MLLDVKDKKAIAMKKKINSEYQFTEDNIFCVNKHLHMCKWLMDSQNKSTCTMPHNNMNAVNCKGISSPFRAFN